MLKSLARLSSILSQVGPDMTRVGGLAAGGDLNAVFLLFLAIMLERLVGARIVDSGSGGRVGGGKLILLLCLWTRVGHDS